MVCFLPLPVQQGTVGHAQTRLQALGCFFPGCLHWTALVITR